MKLRKGMKNAACTVLARKVQKDGMLNTSLSKPYVSQKP